MNNNTENIYKLIFLVQTVARLCRDWRLIPPIEIIIECQGRRWRVDCSSADSIELALPPPRAPFTVRLTDTNGTVVEEAIPEMRLGSDCEQSSVL